MIRVNLLPKDDTGRKGPQLHMPAIGAFVPLFVAIVVAVACAGVYFQQLRAYQSLATQVATAKEESQKLAPQIARIRQLTAEREQVDRRLDAITALDKDRYYRVHLMSELARKCPDNTWITLLEEKSPSTLKLEGITFSNFTVADFLRDLTQSDNYHSVDLDLLERGFIKQTRVIKFSATAHVGNSPVEMAADARPPDIATSDN